MLPLVASTTVWPGFSAPAALGRLDDVEREPVLDRGRRVEELGLDVDRRVPSAPRLLTRIAGVSPTVSRMLSKRRPRPAVVLMGVAGGIVISCLTGARSGMPDAAEDVVCRGRPGAEVGCPRPPVARWMRRRHLIYSPRNPAWRLCLKLDLSLRWA